MSEKLPKGESQEQYEQSAHEYFGDVGTAKTLGPSADDQKAFRQFLPGKEKEYHMAERYAMGFGKASRSGAFSKPNVGPAIFPNGLKFASDFIDEHTPGKYKPAENPFRVNKPIEQKTKVDLPKPAVTFLDMCMDCMKPIDLSADPLDLSPNLGFITQGNTHMLFAMGLEFGDPFISGFHATCMEKVKEFRKHKQPLVMGGALLSEKDRDALLRWKCILQIHDGREITTGQWMMIKRLERIAVNTQDYLIEQRKRGNFSIYREDRRPA